jgi:hypothetical protein
MVCPHTLYIAHGTIAMVAMGRDSIPMVWGGVRPYGGLIGTPSRVSGGLIMQ